MKFIDADQLPKFLGGTMTDPDGNPRCPSKVSFLYCTAWLPQVSEICWSAYMCVVRKTQQHLLFPDLPRRRGSQKVLFVWVRTWDEQFHGNRFHSKGRQVYDRGSGGTTRHRDQVKRLERFVAPAIVFTLRLSKLIRFFCGQPASFPFRWEYRTEDYNIAFGIKMRHDDNSTTEVLPFKRVTSHMIPEDGSVVCEQPGICESTHADFQQGKTVAPSVLFS